MNINFFHISMAIAIIFSIYHFFIYIGRIKITNEKYSLYFSILLLISTFQVIILGFDSEIVKKIWINLSYFISFKYFLSSLIHFFFRKVLFSIFNLKFEGYYKKSRNIMITIHLFVILFSVIKNIEKSVFLAVLFALPIITFFICDLIFLIKTYKKEKKKIIEIKFVLFFSNIVFKFVFMFIANTRANLLNKDIPLDTLSFFLLSSLMTSIILAYKFNEEYAALKLTEITLKKAKTELERLNENLEKKVNERTLDLDKKNKQQAQFLTNFNHEIRTPLNHINNYIQQDKKAGPYLQSIKNASQSLCDMVKKILTTQNITTGKMIWNHKDIIDLVDFTREKIVFFQNVTHSKNITLDFIRSIDTAKIKINHLALSSVLNCLIDNAIKYNNINGAITINIKKVRDKILFTIKDTGKGISPESLDKIFDSYFQEESSKTDNQGIGAGLYIVKNIMNDIKGDIKVISTPGDGAEFLLQFPICNSAENETGYKTQSQKIEVSKIDLKDSDKGHAYNLLFVEDNRDLQFDHLQHFKKDYNVFYALNGNDALKKLSVINKPDLIICDVMMPKMDGIEFVKLLKKKSDYNKIPVIFLTAKTDQESQSAGVASGAVMYIEKPFLLKDLENIIKNQLNKPADKIENKKDSLSGYDLNPIEKDIINYILAGDLNKEISGKLNKSEKTIKRHRTIIYEKCSVKNGPELITLFKTE